VMTQQTEEIMYGVVTVIFGVCNLVRLSWLFLVAFCNCSVNPMTNPNPSRDNIFSFSYMKCRRYKSILYVHIYHFIDQVSLDGPFKKSPPCNAQVKNGGAIPPLPPCLPGVYLIN
jgi:hypothetical protein